MELFIGAVSAQISECVFGQCDDRKRRLDFWMNTVADLDIVWTHRYSRAAWKDDQKG